VVNAGFLLNVEAVVSQHGVCKVCHEELNMYGACRCNGYTTAFNAVENQHIPQHRQAKISARWYTCSLCGNRFQFNIDGCPKCGGSAETIGCA
jgi:hypothetical protein